MCGIHPPPTQQSLALAWASLKTASQRPQEQRQQVSTHGLLRQAGWNRADPGVFVAGFFTIKYTASQPGGLALSCSFCSPAELGIVVRILMPGTAAVLGSTGSIPGAEPEEDLSP